MGCNPNEVEGMVIGGHGDTTMIPVARLATYKGIPVSELLSKEALDKVVADTNGWWSYSYRSSWHIGLVRSRCSRNICSRIYYSRSEKVIPCCVALDENMARMIFASEYLLYWAKKDGKRLLT